MTEIKCFYCQRMNDNCPNCVAHSEFVATPESEDGGKR